MRDPNRVYWNEQFKILQDTWPKANEFYKCIDICLMLHGMVHTGEVAHAEQWSFEDELWSKFDEETFRRFFKDDQSIAWKLWHSARIEDMTMNVLIAGEQQIFLNNGWGQRLGVKAMDTGNAMKESEIKELSNSIDMQALRAYREVVGIRTREIIKALQPEDLKKKVQSTCLQRLLNEGGVVEEAKGLLDYWGKKTYSGLMLMPATRHIFVHLNESLCLLRRRKEKDNED